MAATKKPIFRLAVRLEPNKPPVERLIRGTSRAAVVEFGTKGLITCEPADIDDAIRLAHAGVKVEDSTTEAAAASPPAPPAKGNSK